MPNVFHDELNRVPTVWLLKKASPETGLAFKDIAFKLSA